VSNLSGIPTQIRDQFRLLSPPWLSEYDAEKFGYTLGVCSDVLLEKAFQAVTIRIPGLGDPSQLPYLSSDRLLVQGPGETDAEFVLRLQNCFAAHKKRGSRLSILGQLQAYAANLQPGVAAGLPLMGIVGSVVGSSILGVATWDVLYNGQEQGAAPYHSTVIGGGGGPWDWDGLFQVWRSWLILYMHLAPTALSGAAAETSAAFGNAGDTGHTVSGVWVPNAGVTLNTPFMNMTGLSGLSAANIGMWLTVSGSSHAGNNGTFPIVSVASATTCAIANPAGVASDSGPLTWLISYYPWIGPGPVWGAPGYTFGQGASPLPPEDTGELVNGVWQPATDSAPYGTSYSWGLSVPAQTIAAMREIVQTWKAGQVYYPNIIVAFDGSTGAVGSAYSPLSGVGSGNPDGTFGPVGQNPSSVWVPTRQVSSPYDCFCNGTGTRRYCTVEDIT
jgi:hypothetical protein